MKTVAKSPLIDLLAATDALFEPVRTWERGRVAEIMHRRRRFAAEGLPIAGGGTESERKALERQLDEIEQSGAVTFSRHQGKRTGWRLTDTIDWQLRRLCTWHDWPDMLTLMYAVRAHQDVGHVNDGFVPEWTLAGLDPDAQWTEGDRMLLHYIAWTAAAGLCRGYLTSLSDLYGWAGYRVTEAGRRFLERSPVEPELPDHYSSELNDIYIAAVVNARKTLATVKSEATNEVPSRLSCGTWPRPEAAAPIPPIFTKRRDVRSPESMRAAIRRATKTTNAIACPSAASEGIFLPADAKE